MLSRREVVERLTELHVPAFWASIVRLVDESYFLSKAKNSQTGKKIVTFSPYFCMRALHVVWLLKDGAVLDFEQARDQWVAMFFCNKDSVKALTKTQKHEAYSKHHCVYMISESLPPKEHDKATLHLFWLASKDSIHWIKFNFHCFISFLFLRFCCWRHRFFFLVDVSSAVSTLVHLYKCRRSCPVIPKKFLFSAMLAFVCHDMSKQSNTIV